jgi:hypothetical protein
MKLLNYEIKKLIVNKFLLITFALLLCLDAFLCIYETNKTKSNTDKNLVAKIYNEYSQDSEKVKKEYDKLSKLNNEYDALLAINSEPDESQKETLASYTEFFTWLEYKEKYNSDIQNIIEKSKDYIEEYKSVGVSEDTYLYNYNQEVIELYSKTVKLNIPVEYTRGWDYYFIFGSYNLLIILFLILTIPLIILGDMSNGFLPIIRSTKKGRANIIITKCCCSFIVTIFSVIVFSCIPLLIFGIKYGYSSLSGYIQAFKTYELCPYILKIWQAVFLSLGIKILIFTSLSAIIMFFASITKKYTFTYLLSLIYCGLNYMLTNIVYLNNNSFFKLMNLFTVIDTDSFFRRYWAINLFGHAISYLSVIISISVLLTAFCFIAVSILHCKTKGIRKLKQIKFNFRFPSLHIPCRVNNLFGYELYKMIISNKFIVVIILFIIAKALISSNIYENKSSSGDNFYKYYMTILEGPATEEKKEYITKERQQINETIQNKDYMESQFADNKITYENYREYLTQYSVSELKNKYFSEIEKHAEYIDKKAKKNISAHFVYDSGWKKLFLSEFDYILCGLLLILYTGIFADEYKSGFTYLHNRFIIYCF